MTRSSPPGCAMPGWRQQALVEDVDYRAARGLDRPLFQKLVAGDWIDAHDNLIVCGRPASANPGSPVRSATRPAGTIGSVLYQRVPKLFGDLVMARADGRYPRITRALGGVPAPSSSTIGASSRSTPRPGTTCWKSLRTLRPPLDHHHQPVARRGWHAVIGDPTYADAILDRLVHNAHRLNLFGDSLRRTRSKPAERG
ncbi:MAG: ATP-binding protein [Aliidongia sp.]